MDETVSVQLPEATSQGTADVAGAQSAIPDSTGIDATTRKVGIPRSSASYRGSRRNAAREARRAIRSIRRAKLDIGRIHHESVSAAGGTNG